MIVKNINKVKVSPRVLVAALDWGLGHATRCIPIINILIEHNIEVLVAADGPVANLLQKEFPALVILPLKGYNIRYSRSKNRFFLSMLAQFPKLTRLVNYEKKWLKKIVELHGIDGVISDNRFGLNHSNTPCVYVSHQLFINTGSKWLDKIAQRMHYHFINKFDECWVPDLPGPDNLAGKLSHPTHLPNKPVKYIGILSRCTKMITQRKYSLLIILSGPEPQRTIFENILLPQLKNMEGTVALVRGLPGNKDTLVTENRNLLIHDHLPANALSELIQQSENIIARSGYSTIMDLAALERNAILVPTPGQTEQEYLAGYLGTKKMFFTCTQENFSLQQALDENMGFVFAPMTATRGIDKEPIVAWIKKISTAISSPQ